jgi:hypothetical protein
MSKVVHIATGVRVYLDDAPRSIHDGNRDGGRTGNFVETARYFYVVATDEDGDVIENEDFDTAGERDAFIARYPNAGVTMGREPIVVGAGR